MAKKSSKTSGQDTAADEIRCVDLGEKAISTNLIDASSINPRRQFSEKELEELTESLQKHGQMQNLTVRPKGDRFELIGGERRLRALRRAEIPTANCRVLDCDDATAIELRGVENYRREQLNAIEEASWFEQMLSTKRYNQSSLAKFLGIDASQVSNRLRLLKLPPAWQDRIVSGEIPPTHARSLVGWVHRPVILENLIGVLKRSGETFETLTVSKLDAHLISLANSQSSPVDPAASGGPLFEITEEVRKDLDIEQVPGYLGGEPRPRAFNIELWETLQAEAKKAADAPRGASNDTEETSPRPAKNKKSTPSTETPSDASESGPSVNQLTQANLEAYFSRVVAEQVSLNLKPDGLAIRLFLDLVQNWWRTIKPSLERSFSEAAGAESDPNEGVFGLTEHVNLKSFPAYAVKQVRSVLTGEHVDEVFGLQFLHRLAIDDLTIAPLGGWVADRELLETCSTSQLREIVPDELETPVKLEKMTRPALIQTLLDNWKPGYLPELLFPDSIR